MHHLPIFSFLIRKGHRFLHHNFVCALLNDLFGVQSRGGIATDSMAAVVVIAVVVVVAVITASCASQFRVSSRESSLRFAT